MLIVVFGTSVMAFPSVTPQALKQLSESCCAESDILGWKEQSTSQSLLSSYTIQASNKVSLNKPKGSKILLFLCIMSISQDPLLLIKRFSFSTLLG